MLKRYQVLLASWQGDYMKRMAEKYDVSFSEAIRGALCLAILCAVPKVYPEYKPGKLGSKPAEVSKKAIKKGERAEIHKLLSNLYYEARKAAEFSLAKDDKGKHTKKIFSQE